MKRTITATAALPYANGEIHIGHLVEYIQADIWTRFQKMRGHECLYICADDTHGTPVMISARNQGITPQELITRMNERHREDFRRFHIEFDNYSTTNSDENRELSELIYTAACEKGHITSREINQYYCEKDEMFLPDRFIKGQCPKCSAEDQYGDSCESCGAAYSPTDLKNPFCSLCATPPVMKKSIHYFFKLGDFTDMLKRWASVEHINPGAVNKLQEWFSQGLREWDISRDKPYFGFKIPGTEDKYFYVWMDAPVGYIASTKIWAEQNGKDYLDYWKNPDAEIHHFIGKDIMYFHTLFWPSMLSCAGFQLPDKVHIHGFLTVNGKKMSKSRGTFINAATYLKHLDPEYLRYYYAYKLSSAMDDIDLSVDDFIAKVNSDLVGKFANLASRSAPMLYKKLDGRMGGIPEDARAMLDEFTAAGEDIARMYEVTEFSRVLARVLELAEKANKYIEDHQPWTTIKTDPEATRGTLTAALNAFRLIALYLKPVIPEFARKAEELFNLSPMTWQDHTALLEDHTISKFAHIIQRAEKESVEAMIEESRQEKEEADTPQTEYEPIAPECTFDDFMRLDLRVGRITEAETIEKADKLLRLTVDIGIEKRNIIAGIKKAFTPEDLTGRLVVIAANLKPRKMKFGTSEGMVLAAGPGESELFLLSPDDGARPGQRVS